MYPNLRLRLCQGNRKSCREIRSTKGRERTESKYALTASIPVLYYKP